MKKLNTHFQLYINSEWRSGSADQIMYSQNPHNNQMWASFDCANKKDIDLAVKSAKDALSNQTWKSMTATNRGKLLNKLADLIEINAEIIGSIETQDSGKLLAETVSQTKYVSDYYRYFAGMADKIEGSTLPIDKEEMHVYTTHHPIGVVAVIVPWNAQMFLTATKLAPALAAGCSVIIKASEIAPCAIFELAKLIDQVGFPKGVVSVITGDTENCSIPLTSHPDIDRIAFTGGTETAKKIIKNSANNFAATNLELGGKSPLIIFDDADIESAANGIIAGNFGASGQSCVAGSRVIVQKNIASQLIDLIKKKSQNITIGDPLDPKTNLGPLCTNKQIQNDRKNY
jgi:aldehyde dehydrogenase (NAD+)